MDSYGNYEKYPAACFGVFWGLNLSKQASQVAIPLHKSQVAIWRFFPPSPCGFLGMEVSGNLPWPKFHDLPAKLLAHLGKFQGAPCIRGRHVSWMQDIQVFSQGSFRCRTNDATTKNRFRVFFGAEKLQPADRSSVLRWGECIKQDAPPSGAMEKTPFFKPNWSFVQQK